jgi:hypothetical protein
MVWPPIFSAPAAVVTGFNNMPPDLSLTGWFLPASIKDLAWLCVMCPGRDVEAAAAVLLWNFVPLSPLPLCWLLLLLRRWVRGDLYRSVPVSAAQCSGSAAGASSWVSVQEQGPWREGGGSGGFPRRRRRDWPDLGPELLGDDPRSTLHMVKSFAGGGALHRLRKLLDGDGATPAHGVVVGQAAWFLLIWEERRPWCRWCLGTSRGLSVIFFFLRSIVVPSRSFERCLRVLYFRL